jgi:hypothetical protein
VVEFVVPDRDQLDNAVKAVADLGDREPTVDAERSLVGMRVGTGGSQALVETVRRLDAAGVSSQGLSLRRPSLDDVFLALTGHGVADDGAEEVPTA